MNSYDYHLEEILVIWHVPLSHSGLPLILQTAMMERWTMEVALKDW